MTILVDANLTPFWVEFLQSAGIEAVHWWSAGSGDAPDAELLEWAEERDAAILTGEDEKAMRAGMHLSNPGGTGVTWRTALPRRWDQHPC